MSTTRVSQLPLGVRLCSPDDLSLMTPFVLAEQGDWFEQEIHFVRTLLTPGEAVLDIGANYGVYSLTAAALVGSTGRVWSFEPASRTANYLRDSARLNGYQHLEVIQQALSKEPGEAHLSTHDNAELNTLQSGRGQGGETVAVSTLDDFMARCKGHDVSFLKLDAEGEESNVILGGQRFFAEQSPLVMFELKSSSTHNLGLITEFQAIGYDSYKLIPGLGVLVPFDAAGPLDASLLNLFACKPERARLLQQRGLLADRPSLSQTEPPRPHEDLHMRWLTGLSATRQMVTTWTAVAPPPSPAWNDHRKALNLLAFSLDKDASPAQRFLALRQAQELLKGLSSSDMNIPRACTLVRVAQAMGNRELALGALNALQTQLMQAGRTDTSEPFSPLNTAFESTDPAGRTGDWLIASILDTKRALQHYSAYFNPREALDLLRRAAPLGFGAADIQRRIRLIEQALLAVQEKAKPVHTLSELLPRPERPIQIVDVGALMLDSSDPAPYSKLVTDGLATVVGFEPNQAACNELNEHYKVQGGAHRFYPYFVGDGKPGVYHETNMVMTGSLYRPNRDVMSRYMNLHELCEVIAEHPVPTCRLDDLEDIGLVDYIKIDVQGAELPVFQGASKALNTALFIHTEVEFAELYEGQPLFADVDSHLRNAGFQFHTFVSLGQRSFKPMVFKKNINMGLRQLLWADALYVRDVRQFKQLQGDQLIKIALIAHEVYQSYDLAHLALLTLDEQRGSQHAQAYLSLLQRQVPGLMVSTVTG